MTSMYLSGSTRHYVDESGRYVTYWRIGYSDAKVAPNASGFSIKARILISLNLSHSFGVRRETSTFLLIDKE